MDPEEYLRRAAQIADEALRYFTEYLDERIAEGTLPAATADAWRQEAVRLVLRLKDADYDPAALDQLDAGDVRLTLAPGSSGAPMLSAPHSATLKETLALALEQIELLDVEDEGGESRHSRHCGSLVGRHGARRDSSLTRPAALRGRPSRPRRGPAGVELSRPRAGLCRHQSRPPGWARRALRSPQG